MVCAKMAVRSALTSRAISASPCLTSFQAAVRDAQKQRRQDEEEERRREASARTKFAAPAESGVVLEPTQSQHRVQAERRLERRRLELKIGQLPSRGRLGSFLQLRLQRTNSRQTQRGAKGAGVLGAGESPAVFLPPASPSHAVASSPEYFCLSKEQARQKEKEVRRQLEEQEARHMLCSALLRIRSCAPFVAAQASERSALRGSEPSETGPR